eukprot:318506-Prymnesium_polylepis.1
MKSALKDPSGDVRSRDRFRRRKRCRIAPFQSWLANSTPSMYVTAAIVMVSHSVDTLWPRGASGMVGHRPRAAGSVSGFLVCCGAEWIAASWCALCGESADGRVRLLSCVA